MSVANHVVRREAVYYFRRRLPKVVQGRNPAHVFLSLRTRDPARARRIASYVSAAFEDLVMSAEAHFLTKTQVDGVLRAVVETHLAKLDRVAAAAKMDAGFDLHEAERQDHIVGWAYRLLYAQGTNAVVRDEDRLEIRKAGLSDDDIGLIEDHLLRLRFNGMVPTHHGKLHELLAAQGAAPTAMNLAQAQNLYFRGLSLALLHSQARYRGPGPDDFDFVKTMLEQGIPDRVRATSAPTPITPVVAQTVNAPAPVVEQSSVDHRIVTFGDELIRVRGKDERWDRKTQKQARQLYALMDRFLVEERDVRGVAALNQQHLAKFVTFLRHDMYKFYGRSSKDEQRSVQELRAIATSKPEALRGVVGGTLNRHLTNIDQLLEHARGQGLKVSPDLKTVALRSKKANRGRARDQRPKLGPAVAARIFQATPFTGCVSWDQALEAGCEIYHRALYFVPLLLEYGGGRREEICGLEVDDVIEGQIPYIHVRANATRRIKNAQSDRFLPIHPEVLRLGFLDYVAAIRALGYRLLFPCLFSPTTSSPLGDRLCDEFKPILVWACEQERADPDTVIHSFRHGFNSTLKAKHVRAEERADLMGHGGDSETTERYADPIQLRRALQLLKKIPVVTAHLKAVPIRLLPWVEQKSVAPFSRARRKMPSDERVA